MSFLYPRTVAVHRSKTNVMTSTAVGLLGYSGRENSTSSTDAEGETVILTDIPADIQAQRPGGLAKFLPGDAAAGSMWSIMVPAQAVEQYAIRDRDFIVDDEGYRYIVLTAYWQGMGYDLKCTRLET